MNKAFIAIAAVLLVSLSCSSFTPKDETDTPDEYAERYGGDVEEYARIIALSDCTELKMEFGKYYNIWVTQEGGTPEKKMNTGYMAAASSRMHYLSCQ
jgi:hypothetical protein